MADGLGVRFVNASFEWAAQLASTQTRPVQTRLPGRRRSSAGPPQKGMPVEQGRERQVEPSLALFECGPQPQSSGVERRAKGD